jgi:hypothetical protein
MSEPKPTKEPKGSSPKKIRKSLPIVPPDSEILKHLKIALPALFADRKVRSRALRMDMSNDAASQSLKFIISLTEVRVY